MARAARRAASSASVERGKRGRVDRVDPDDVEAVARGQGADPAVGFDLEERGGEGALMLVPQRPCGEHDAGEDEAPQPAPAREQASPGALALGRRVLGLEPGDLVDAQSPRLARRCRRLVASPLVLALLFSVAMPLPTGAAVFFIH